MEDLKLYCTKEMYEHYLITGHLIGCSPGARNDLLVENREKHKDLNVRLSLSRKKHEVDSLEKVYGKEVEGKWFEVIAH